MIMVVVVVEVLIGSLSNYDDDHNNDFKKTIGLMIKTKAFGILSGSKIIDAIKFERTQIHCFNDGFTAVVVVLA